MLPNDQQQHPIRNSLVAQPSQDDEIVPEEEDALVLRLEAMIMATEGEEQILDDQQQQMEERLSFADSERFDEDDEEQYSAPASESSSFSHHWRGWAGRSVTIREQQAGQGFLPISETFIGVRHQEEDNGNKETCSASSQITSLRDLAARRVASALSFELMESTYGQLPRAQKRLRPACLASEKEWPAGERDYLPEQLVLLILRHCFPDSVENIRLYSCLTNCGDRLFSLGEQLYMDGAVRELYQIGYHLSAVVQERGNNCQLLEGAGRTFDVCIRVDRCQIVSCSCSCSNSSFWCQHAVAACFQRIQKPDSVRYRPAIWDSITSLRDIELKKLAQYLINELPKEYIPVAQKLIDTLKDPRSEINRTQGAPDPTAGPTDDTPAVWCMDERALHSEVRKALINFMKPSAMVCEVQSLLTSPPALAHEWSILHRTLCAKQPESMWNLLGMVRVMLTRGDANGPTLLHILTEECLALDSVLLRWYQISLIASGHWHPIGPNGGGNGGSSGGGQRGGNAQQSQSRQLNVYFLCEELAILWRLVALNPRLNPEERERLWELLSLYQRAAVNRIWSILGNTAENNIFGTVVNSQGHRLNQKNAPFTRQHFAGFFPALQACHQLNWANSEEQRLVRSMPVGSRLATDISSAQRQNGRLPNLPFLREEGICLMELIEMEQQLGNYGGAFNPDAVVLPPKSRKKKKRRKGGGGQLRNNKGKLEKEMTERMGGSSGKGATEWDHKNGRNGKRRRDSANEPSEQLSEMSSDEEARQAENTAGTSRPEIIQRREPFEDVLDTLFAEAHSDLANPFLLRFTCCEALFSHGYFRESLQLAHRLAGELLENQPNLLHPSMNNTFQSERTEEIMKANVIDSSMSGKSEDGIAAKNGAYNVGIDGQEQPLIAAMPKPPFAAHLRFHQQHSRHQIGQTDSFGRHHSAAGPSSSLRGGGWLSRSHPRLMSNSLITRETLWRTLFLSKILLLGEEFTAKRRARKTAVTTKSVESTNKAYPEPGYYRLRALELCLATMQNCRGPAATKLLEMEINHLEGELCDFLLHLELCPAGLHIVRSIAKQWLSNQANRAENWPNNVTVPPTRMAHYALNALSYSHHIPRNIPNRVSQVMPPCQPGVFAHRVPADEELSLDLVLQILHKDVYISETDHPLLCECIRRHRKDLQITLLSRNRDAPEKLARILGTVLDSKVHRMYEDHHRSNMDFFLPSPLPSSNSAAQVNSAPCQSADSVSVSPSIHINQSRPPPPASVHSSCSSGSSPSISPFQTRRIGVGLDGEGNCNRRTSEEQSGAEISSNGNSPAPRRMVERYPMYTPAGTSLPLVLANQASEAQAHHMFEFAKSLLQEAGGNQSSAMFNPMIVEGGVGGGAGGAGFAVGNAVGGGATSGPHRNLHICSLLVALYALGLNNECSPSWNTRTYSTHVSWIQAQALDIGRQALEIIRRTWRKHLTPTEVASLADKASQSGDQATVEEAAHLALSVLPEANSLLPAESQKALNQCKERSPKMLEEACFAVEKAAERGGVYPEVLFRVAHHWYDLYLAHLELLGGSAHGAGSSNHSPRHHVGHPTNHQQHSPQYWPLPVQPTSYFLQFAAENMPSTSAAAAASSTPHSAQSPLTTAYTSMNRHPQYQQHQFRLGMATTSINQQQFQMMATVLPPSSIGTHSAAFFSPTVPPPRFPAIAAHNQIGGAIVSSAVGATAANRLQPSFSAPNMSSSSSSLAVAHHNQPCSAPPPAPQTGPILSPLFPPLHCPPPPHSSPLLISGLSVMTPQQQQQCITPISPHMVQAYHYPPPLPSSHHHKHHHVPFSPQPLATAIKQVSPPTNNHHRAQQQSAGNHHYTYSRGALLPSGSCSTATISSTRFMDDRSVQLLKNAHRVGIAAMNNLRNTESVSVKFAKNPPSCDEICWLLDISLEIGDPEYVRLFSEKAIACVGSPFVLLELLRGIFKFFQHLPNSHRIPGSGQLDLILQSASSDLAKLCLQQAKMAISQYSLAGPVTELALHAIGAAFNAACHKLNFNSFSAPDQEYVCELTLVMRDLFRLIPPYHEQAKRKYLELFMEHCGKQKCFKKFKSVQTAVQNALQQQKHHQSGVTANTSTNTSTNANISGSGQQGTE